MTASTTPRRRPTSSRSPRESAPGPTWWCSGCRTAWGTWPRVGSTFPEAGALDALVVRAGALGDVLLLRRAVAALHRIGARVHLLAPSGPGRVLVGPGAGEAQRLTALDGPALTGWVAGDVVEEALVEDLRADAVLAVTRSRDLLARLRGLAPRVLERDPSPGPSTPASLWYAEPLRALGADPVPGPPLLDFTSEERRAAGEWASRLPARYLAVHPGSGSPTKNWPAERFAGLVRACGCGQPWLLASGPAEAEVVGPLAALPGAVLARDLPARVLGALLARAGLYVGNDSGVTHLAAAAGAPTLALFGPTDATTWGPVGPLVETVSSPDRSMKGLDLARAREAAARLLERASRR